MKWNGLFWRFNLYAAYFFLCAFMCGVIVTIASNQTILRMLQKSYKFVILVNCCKTIIVTRLKIFPLFAVPSCHFPVELLNFFFRKSTFFVDTSFEPIALMHQILWLMNENYQEIPCSDQRWICKCVWR